MYKQLKKREGILKKVLASIAIIVTLSGCAETIAFLGPASTAAGSGNIARSALTSVVDYGIKKSTGKSSFQHAMNYAEKHNPDRKKVKCVEFLEATESEVCSILKKRVSKLREKIDMNSKIKILD